MKAKVDPKSDKNSSDAKPSEFKDAFWIYARRQRGTYPHRTEKSGKWLLFVPTESIDAVWEKIRRATEQGRLGNASKVSTALPKPNFKDTGKRVICVYTCDSDDADDVRQIRAELRKLGFTNKISYKTDEDSWSGKYQVTGHRNISKYYE